MKKEIIIWYDKKADFLEVMFEKKHGYFRDTENDAVMEKVDMNGNIIGFSITKVSALDKPLRISLNDNDVKSSSLSLEDSIRENGNLLSLRNERWKSANL